MSSNIRLIVGYRISRTRLQFTWTGWLQSRRCPVGMGSFMGTRLSLQGHGTPAEETEKAPEGISHPYPYWCR